MSDGTDDLLAGVDARGWPREVRERVRNNDWDTHPVVDVVTYLPATSTGLEGDRRRVEVHRHEEPPPRDSYATSERAARVERVRRDDLP